MPRHPLILCNVALLLLGPLMMVIDGASSMQRRQVASDASPPKDSIVIDSIGDLPTSTRFERPACWGAGLSESGSVGPEFTLTRTTTITEIGAYIESCWPTGSKP